MSYAPDLNAAKSLVRRVCAALAALCVQAAGPTVSAQTGASAGELGTWLMTPAERAQALQQRYAARDGAEDATTPAQSLSTWLFQGLSYVQGGAASAWINGKLVQAGQALDGGALVEAIDVDTVTLDWQGRRHRLRPGEALNSDGEITDTLPASMSKNTTANSVAPQAQAR